MLVRARYGARNPRPDHRLRRRTSRGHEPRRGTGVLRLQGDRAQLDLREPVRFVSLLRLVSG